MHYTTRSVGYVARCAVVFGAGFAIVATACSTDTKPSVTLGEPVAVSVLTGVGAAPVIALSPKGQRAVAWVSAPDSGTDGRLYVSVDGAPPVELRDSLGPIEAHGEAPPKLAYDTAGVLHALYVVGKVVPGRRFPLSALRHISSVDGGHQWSPPASVTDADVFGSYNFHSLHAAANGELIAAWLDGRDGTSATFTTRSMDGGHTWSPNIRVDSAESCPCCRTAIATDGKDNVYLAWRTVMPGNIRDIVVAHSGDNGATYGTPVRVHADEWQFDGCPHAGPSMQVDAAGRLHIAWWTGKDGKAGVYYAQSSDHAATFATPIAMGVAQYSKPAHAQLALGDSGVVAVVWDDGTLESPVVTLRMSYDSGATFATAVVLSAAERAAAFPMVNIYGKQLMVVWSEQSREAAEHAAHSRPDMKDPTATMGLSPVGASVVVMRQGTVR